VSRPELQARPYLGQKLRPPIDESPTPGILDGTVRTWLFILLCSLSTCPTSAQSGQDPSSGSPSWPVETRSAETGLRVWEFPGTNEGVFSLLILVGVGSRDEKPAQAGISHFLEHCLFLSTQKRSEKDLIQGLRAQGGVSNGQTTEDWTAYWVSLPASRWRFGVDWLTEHLAQPGFDSQEVAREQGIVVEEIQTRHQHGKPPTFEALLYGDHPLGRNIAGSEATVRSVDGAAVESWYREHYRLDNLIVAYAGAVPASQCIQRIQEQLGELPRSSQPRRDQPLTPRLGRSLLRLGMRPSGDRRGFLMQGYVLSPGDPIDLASLLHAKVVLDDAIFDEIRTNRGLAYAPQAGLGIHDAAWQFDCRIEVGESKSLPSVLEGTTLSFQALPLANGEEFARAKRAVISSLTVTKPGDLLYCTELAWALLTSDGTPDLMRTVRQLDSDRYAARISDLLSPEREFVISDSVDLINPSFKLFWLFIAALAAAAGLIWWLPRHLHQRRTRRSPKRAPKKQPVAPALAPPSDQDVDDIERQFETWFREQDDKDDQ